MYNRGSTKRPGKRTTTRATKHRPQMIEELECRQLLTTLYGGGDGRLATYFYATDGSTMPNAEIDIYGNVTAEFIFMHGATQEIANRDLDGSTLGLNIFSDNPTTPTGSDLFAIYVSHSDINSYISITSINPTTGAITPFGGGTGFNAYHANGTTASVAGPAGAGSLTLGALTPRIVPDTTTPSPSPTIKADINGSAIGVRPAGLDDLPDDPSNDLSAGLRVANGQDLGKFLFDGEVFGQVRVDGSMNLFYAGWLLTGDALGASEGFGASGLPTSLSNQTVTSADQQLGESRHIVPRQNFYIGGDLQNLATIGPIGWDGAFGPNGDLDPHYLSGVDIYVRGRLGQVHANQGNTATITVLNMDPATAGFVRPVEYQEELEGFNHFGNSGVVGDIGTGFPNTPIGDFSGGVLYGPTPARGNVPFTNDTFDSFQMVGTFSSPRGNNIVDLLGNIDGLPADPDTDPIDFYGIPLMAGQTITIQAVELFGTNNLHVGVFDPDGRLIASDYSNLKTPDGSTTGVKNLPFQITADRPGIYRIALAEGGDTGFVGTPNTQSVEQYELIVNNLGVLAFGGLTVANQFTGTTRMPAGAARMLDVYPGQNQIAAQNGDFGGVYISAQFNTIGSRQYIPTVTPPPNSFNFNVKFGTVYVATGDLRAFDASQIGVGTLSEETTFTGLDLNVPNGSVGLVQTRDANAVLSLNPSVEYAFRTTIGTAAVSPTPTTPAAFTPAELSVGFNYQVINAAGRFEGAVAAKGGMGTLRAGSIDGIGDQTFIYLDTDSKGFDGNSDLIDVSGSIDGPALIHGPGGNFRYFRVGGTVGVDSYFGVSNVGYVAHYYGQSAQFTDDSGSNIILTPVGQQVANPAYDPLDPSKGPQFLLPQLSTLAYPVRSGGEIVMDVQSTGSLTVHTQAGSFGGTAEISRIEVHGNGVVPTRTTRYSHGTYQTTLAEPFNSDALGTSLSVIITGSAVTDVAYIVGLTPEPGNSFYTSPNTTIFLGNITPVLRSSVSTFSNLTLVSNTTGGEILSVNAASLGTLYSSGTVGVTRTTAIPGNSLNFIDPISVGTAYAARPTDDTGNAPVNPTGTVVGSAFPFDRQTFGIAVGGDIVSIIANRGVGNIVATGIIGSVVANSDGKNITGVIEGINAPIFADAGTSAPTVGNSSGISNGSILSVNIGEGMGSAGSGDFARTGIFAGNAIGTINGSNADIRGDIVFGQSLGSINLTNGSLIDANIFSLFTDVQNSVRETGGPVSIIGITNAGVVRTIGSINLKGNGGMIGTVIATTSIGSINVSGFGIISSEIITAFSSTGINSITVGGYGIRNSIINVGNNLGIVNVTGNGKNLSTNQLPASVRESELVHADPLLGYGFDPYSGRPLIAINDIHAALGTSQASPIIAGVTDTGVVENTQIAGQRSLGTIKAQVFRGDPAYDRIDFGNGSIGLIQSRGLIDGLGIITGSIKNFMPGSDVLDLQMSISGLLNKLTIKGTLGAGSDIEAQGLNGRIGNISIKKNFNGTIHAVQTIGAVTIGGDLNGTLKIDGLARNAMALKKLQVGGTIANGSLDIGASGAVVNVGQIIVKKSLGSSANDSLDISGSIAKLQVGGFIESSISAGGGIGTLQAQRIDGPVHAGGDIKNLFVKSGGLRGDLTVDHQLRNAVIAGGISGTIDANNGVGNITVASGDVAAGAVIQTGFGSINMLKVTGGDLDGSVISAGKINQIIVGGNVGDGTTPLLISGTQLGLLQLGGSIRSGVSIHITGAIDALIVGHNIDEGALVQASALNHQQVGGQISGTLSIG